MRFPLLGPLAPPRPYAFEICDEEGCHLGNPIDPSLSAEPTTGKFAVLQFIDGGQCRVAAPISLDGYDDALKVMAKARK